MGVIAYPTNGKIVKHVSGLKFEVINSSLDHMQVIDGVDVILVVQFTIRAGMYEGPAPLLADCADCVFIDRKGLFDVDPDNDCESNNYYIKNNNGVMRIVGPDFF